MNESRYQIEQDSHHRWKAQVTKDLAVAVNILSETDNRRIGKGPQQQHGHAILYVQTSVGMLIHRDIRIMYSRETKQHYLRWRQWNLQQAQHQSPESREHKKDDVWLDISGPQDPIDRRKFEELILSVFHQVREEAAQGTLGRGPIGDQLRNLRTNLKQKQTEDGTNE